MGTMQHDRVVATMFEGGIAVLAPEADRRAGDIEAEPQPETDRICGELEAAIVDPPGKALPVAVEGGEDEGTATATDEYFYVIARKPEA